MSRRCWQICPLGAQSQHECNTLLVGHRGACPTDPQTQTTLSLAELARVCLADKSLVVSWLCVNTSFQGNGESKALPKNRSFVNHLGAGGSLAVPSEREWGRGVDSCTPPPSLLSDTSFPGQRPGFEDRDCLGKFCELLLWKVWG